jgi:hypothetical protein
MPAKTHGMHAHPVYKLAHEAKRRCTVPSNPAYPRYGGRGIEWRFKDFSEFYAHIGPRPSSKHLLDRIDNDGHYEPGNVRWATPKQSLANRRPYRRKVECVCEWCGAVTLRVKPARFCTPSHRATAWNAANT